MVLFLLFDVGNGPRTLAFTQCQITVAALPGKWFWTRRQYVIDKMGTVALQVLYDIGYANPGWDGYDQMHVIGDTVDRMDITTYCGRLVNQTGVERRLYFRPD